MTNVAGKGRPSHTPLKKAVSECVKHTEDHQLLEKEFDILTGLSQEEKGSERYEELEDVINQRKCLAEEKDDLTRLIRQYSAENDQENKEKYFNRRQKVDLELRELPPLGYTEDEWEEEASEEDKEQERGRPTLELEVKLVRVERSLRDARIKAGNLIKEELQEKENIAAKERAAEIFASQEVDEDSEKELLTEEQIYNKERVIVKDKDAYAHLDSLIKVELDKEIKPGRPKSDELAKLDKRLVDTRRKIEHIESGEAQKERDAKVNLSEKGNKRGRTPTPFDELLMNLKNEEVSIIERIELLESKLDRKGKWNRQLKLVRDQKRALKKQLLSEGMTNAEMLKNKEMKSILKQEDSLLKKLNKSKGNKATKRPKVTADKSNKTAQKIAKSKRDELSKERAEDSKTAQDLEDEKAMLLKRIAEIDAQSVVNG